MVGRRLHGRVDVTPDYSTCYRTYRINISLFREPCSFTLACLGISLEYFSTLTLSVTEFFPVQNALYCPQLLLSCGSSNFNYNCHHQKMSLEGSVSCSPLVMNHSLHSHWDQSTYMSRWVAICLSLPSRNPRGSAGTRVARVTACLPFSQRSLIFGTWIKIHGNKFQLHYSVRKLVNL